MDADTSSLAAENQVLRSRVQQLEKELAFLRTHPVFLQGLKGETLIVDLCQGRITEFATPYDVLTKGQLKVEVKFSKLNVPYNGARIRRWNWSKPLGWKDKGKDFDFLVLVGEKDLAHASQYPDDGPYVFFVVPKAEVSSIMTKGAAIGANVQINTDLSSANSPASRALKKFLVPQNKAEVLFGGARPT